MHGLFDIVYGRTFEEALINLELVLQRIMDAGLKLKPSKCLMFRVQVPFLGHIVMREGVIVDPAKTDAIDKWPTPRLVKDVRSFLGTASYYRRFIENFARIAAPLNNLLKKDPKTKLIWTEDARKLSQS